MNNSSKLALALVAALTLAGSVTAQTGSSTSQTNGDRVARRCTTGTLSPGTTAACSDDAVYDGPAVAPNLVSPSPPPGVTPTVGNTNSTNPGNPASLGNPGSLSTTPPSLSNNPLSPSSPSNTGTTGSAGTTGTTGTTGSTTTTVAPAGRAGGATSAR